VIRTTNRPTICTLGDTVVIGCFMNRRAVSTLSLAVEPGCGGKWEGAESATVVPWVHLRGEMSHSSSD
jgi:hypothetical protein